MGPGKATFRAPSQPAWPKGWYGAAFWVGGQRRSRRAPGKMRWVLARSGCGADRSGDRERSLWQGLQAASGDKHTVTPEGVVMNRLGDKAGGLSPHSEQEVAMVRWAQVDFCHGGGGAGARAGGRGTWKAPGSGAQGLSRGCCLPLRPPRLLHAQSNPDSHAGVRPPVAITTGSQQ